MLQRNIVKRLRRLIASPDFVAFYFKEKMKSWRRKLSYKIDKNKSYYPNNVVLLPTNRCNLSCASCNIGLSHSEKKFADTFERKKEISIDEWHSIVDKISFFSPRVSISGGEPFLYPEILELVKYIKHKGLHCSLTTNATISLKKGLEELVDSGLDSLTISIDGIGETHDQIRGIKGSFDKTMSFLNKIIAYRKYQRSFHPFISINCVMSSLNQGRLEEVADFFVNYDIDSLTYSHVWFYNQEMINLHNKLCLNTPYEIKETIGGRFGTHGQKDRNLEELWAKIGLIKEKYGDLNISFFPDLKNFNELEVYYLYPGRAIRDHKKCYAPWNTIEVFPDGDVEFAGSCFHIHTGNLIEQDFDDVWNSDSFLEIRKKIKSIGAFPICARCCYIFQQL